jgi:hypothetical protein
VLLFYAQVGFFLWVILGEHEGFLLQLNQVKFVIKKYLIELLVSHLFDHKFFMILKICWLSSYLSRITLMFLFLSERVAVRPNLTERFPGTEAADQGHDLGQQAVPTYDRNEHGI